MAEVYKAPLIGRFGKRLLFKVQDSLFSLYLSLFDLSERVSVLEDGGGGGGSSSNDIIIHSTNQNYIVCSVDQSYIDGLINGSVKAFTLDSGLLMFLDKNVYGRLNPDVLADLKSLDANISIEYTGVSVEEIGGNECGIVKITSSYQDDGGFIKITIHGYRINDVPK